MKLIAIQDTADAAGEALGSGSVFAEVLGICSRLATLALDIEISQENCQQGLTGIPYSAQNEGV